MVVQAQSNLILTRLLQSLRRHPFNVDPSSSNMSSDRFPDISPAESDAHELLTLCYVRSAQISERIRTMEPGQGRVKVGCDQALQDLRSKPNSIAHGPPRSDVKQRAERLKQCHEVFEGPHRTLYE